MAETQVFGDFDPDTDTEEEGVPRVRAGSLQAELLGKAFPLYIGENVIGREANVEVDIDYIGVSKRHATIYITENRTAEICDHKSKGNTFLDKRSQKHALHPGTRQPINDGQCVIFGNLRCVFALDPIPSKEHKSGDLTPTLNVASDAETVTEDELDSRPPQPTVVHQPSSLAHKPENTPSVSVVEAGRRVTKPQSTPELETDEEDMAPVVTKNQFKANMLAKLSQKYSATSQKGQGALEAAKGPTPPGKGKLDESPATEEEATDNDATEDELEAPKFVSKQAFKVQMKAKANARAVSSKPSLIQSAANQSDRAVPLAVTDDGDATATDEEDSDQRPITSMTAFKANMKNRLASNNSRTTSSTSSTPTVKSNGQALNANNSAMQHQPPISVVLASNFSISTSADLELDDEHCLSKISPAKTKRANSDQKPTRVGQDPNPIFQVTLAQQQQQCPIASPPKSNVRATTRFTPLEPQTLGDFDATQLETSATSVQTKPSVPAVGVQPPNPCAHPDQQSKTLNEGVSAPPASKWRKFSSRIPGARQSRSDSNSSSPKQVSPKLSPPPRAVIQDLDATLPASDSPNLMEDDHTLPQVTSTTVTSQPATVQPKRARVVCDATQAYGLDEDDQTEPIRAAPLVEATIAYGLNTSDATQAYAADLDATQPAFISTAERSRVIDATQAYDIEATQELIDDSVAEGDGPAASSSAGRHEAGLPNSEPLLFDSDATQRYDNATVPEAPSSQLTVSQQSRLPLKGILRPPPEGSDTEVETEDESETGQHNGHSPRPHTSPKQDVSSSLTSQEDSQITASGRVAKSVHFRKAPDSIIPRRNTASFASTVSATSPTLLPEDDDSGVVASTTQPTTTLVVQNAPLPTPEASSEPAVASTPQSGAQRVSSSNLAASLGELEDLKVPELKMRMSQLGLTVEKGHKKADLIAQLRAHSSALSMSSVGTSTNVSDSAPAPSNTDSTSPTVSVMPAAVESKATSVVAFEEPTVPINGALPTVESMSTSVILSQLEALKVSDLRLEMEAIGLPSKGLKKAEMISRLFSHPRYAGRSTTVSDQSNPSNTQEAPSVTVASAGGTLARSSTSTVTTDSAVSVNTTTTAPENSIAASSSLAHSMQLESIAMPKPCQDNTLATTPQPTTPVSVPVSSSTATAALPRDIVKSKATPQKRSASSMSGTAASLDEEAAHSDTNSQTSSRRQSGTPNDFDAKRRKSSVVSGDNTKASDVRVAFTGIVDDVVKEFIHELGGSVVDVVDDCTHLYVDDKIKRTIKLFQAIGLAKRVVGSHWVKACKKSRTLLADSLELTPCDGELESKYQFNLKDSFARSSQSRLLAGMHFFVSDNVRPPPDEMKRIIEANGGGFLSAPPEASSQDSFIIARDAQDIKPAWRNLDVPVFEGEFLLSGVLRQRLDFSANCLLRASLAKRKAGELGADEDSHKPAAGIRRSKKKTKSQPFPVKNQLDYDVKEGTKECSEEKLSIAEIKGAIGRPVVVAGKGSGILRFYGKTHFRAGQWCGVALAEPTGDCDGTVKGKAYFSCPTNHGIFVLPERLSLETEGAASEAVASSAVTSTRVLQASAPAPAATATTSSASRRTSTVPITAKPATKPVATSAASPVKSTPTKGPTTTGASRPATASTAAVSRPSTGLPATPRASVANISATAVRNPASNTSAAARRQSTTPSKTSTAKSASARRASVPAHRASVEESMIGINVAARVAAIDAANSKGGSRKPVAGAKAASKTATAAATPQRATVASSTKAPLPSRTPVKSAVTTPTASGNSLSTGGSRRASSVSSVPPNPTAARRASSGTASKGQKLSTRGQTISEEVAPTQPGKPRKMSITAPASRAQEPVIVVKKREVSAAALEAVKKCSAYIPQQFRDNICQECFQELNLHSETQVSAGQAKTQSAKVVVAPAKIAKLETFTPSASSTNVIAKSNIATEVIPANKIEETQRSLRQSLSNVTESPSTEHAKAVISSGKLADALKQLGEQAPIDSPNSQHAQAVIPEGKLAAATANVTKSSSNLFGVAPATCPVCTAVVFFMEQVEVNGKKYHKKCFRCQVCDKPQSATNYASAEGKVYCKPHFSQLFKTKGNYEEGFGGTRHKYNWVNSNGSQNTSGIDSEESGTDAAAAAVAEPVTSADDHSDNATEFPNNSIDQQPQATEQELPSQNADDTESGQVFGFYQTGEEAGVKVEDSQPEPPPSLSNQPPSTSRGCKVFRPHNWKKTKCVECGKEESEHSSDSLAVSPRASTPTPLGSTRAKTRSSYEAAVGGPASQPSSNAATPAQTPASLADRAAFFEFKFE